MAGQFSPQGREQVIQLYMARKQCDRPTAEAAVDAAVQEVTSQPGQGIAERLGVNGHAPAPQEQAPMQPCCGPECAGGPGKPFTPHYYVIQTSRSLSRISASGVSE